jgi:hypothetical protein
LFLESSIIFACSLQPASRIPEASHSSLLHMVHKLASCFSDGRLVVLIPHGLSGQTSSASGWGSFSGTHRKFNRQDQWSNQRGWSIVFNQLENLRVGLLIIGLSPASTEGSMPIQWHSSLKPTRKRSRLLNCEVHQWTCLRGRSKIYDFVLLSFPHTSSIANAFVVP